MSIMKLLLACITASFTFARLSAGLKCLSCSNVVQPRHCSFIRECPSDHTCGVVKYETVSGDNRYDVGCFSSEDCVEPVRAKRQLTDNHQQVAGIARNMCRECCNTTLCHHNGCGEVGYPEDRGLLCYTCKQETDPAMCEHISVCHKDQRCHIGVKNEFGDNIFTSSCQSKYLCNNVLPNIIGRKREVVSGCPKCCSSDLCNDNCNDNITEPKLTTNAIQPSTNTPQSTDLTTQIPDQINYGNTTSKEFVLIFQENADKGGIIRILIAAKEACRLFIYAPGINFNMNTSLRAGFDFFDLPVSIIANPNALEKKGVYLISEKPISVYGVNDRNGDTEAYLALSISLLGMHYTVIDYRSDDYYSEFMISGIYNNTSISVHINTTDTANVLGKLYYSGDMTVFTLNSLQTIEIVSSNGGSLVGTSITSDKPISVTSGNKCATVYIVSRGGYCAPIVEHLLPVKSWGQKCVIPPLHLATNFILKVLASQNDTTITVTSSQHNVPTVYNVSTDRHFEKVFNAGELPAFVEASNPIYAALISEGSVAAYPVMTTIPSFSQFQNEYNIATPFADNATNTLTIMIQTKYEKDVLVNNLQTNHIHSKNVFTPIGNFSVFDVDVRLNYTHLSHKDTAVRFGVIVHGVFVENSFNSAYAYPGGLRLKSDPKIRNIFQD